MKNFFASLKVLAVLLFGSTTTAQTVDCFIIDNPSNASVDIYVVAKGGSFTIPQWNDMVVSLSIPSTGANLGNPAASRPGNAFGGALNTYDTKLWVLAKQPTNVGTAPSFTTASKKYFAYAFAGQTNSFGTNIFGSGQDATLPLNTPVFMCSIPKNGNSFSDITIHARSGVETDQAVILNNSKFYIEIDNLEKSGNVYKEDIIHFNNRLNQVPVVPEPLIWRGGTNGNGEPNLTDGSRNLTVYTGPAVKTMIGAVGTTNFLSQTNIVVMPDAGFQTTSFGTITGADSIIVKADATGYGQYIGPAFPGSIEQYVGVDAGWRNIAFPIEASTLNANRLNLGGAPVNTDVTSTSYHSTPANRDICGTFGNWINTVNMYTFKGATGSPRPHEWYGSGTSIGGTTGYSVFLDNGFFGTTGIISVDGTFTSGPATYSYAHSTPHALNTNGASQALYVGTGCPTDPEVPADRKANWDGWALVANPFACGLDVDAFAATNGLSSSSIRVWNRGKAYEINGGGQIDYQYESMAGKVIPPMQAFFVKVGTNGTSQSLSFLNSHKAFSTENFLKASSNEVELIAMNLSDSSINHTVLAFNPMATNAYDEEFDSYVLSQPRSKTPQVGFHNEYVSNGQTIVSPLYVNTVNEPTQPTAYPVRFWSRSAGNFSFSLNQAKLDPTWTIYVEDTKTAPGVNNNITNQSYNFSYALTDSPTRFILHYVNTAFGVDENNAAAWTATGWFSNTNQLVVGLNGTQLPSTAKIVVFDIAGKVLYQDSNVETSNEIVIENNFTAGVYMVTVEGSNGENRLIKVVKSK